MFDFKKNAKVKTLEEIPEKYRGLYTENDDGEFIIADFAQGIVSDYMGTSDSLTKARSDKTAAGKESAQRREALKSFEDIAEEFGIEFDEDTPLHDALKAKVAELVDTAKNGKELKINLDKMRAEFEKRADEITKAKDGELAGMTSALSKHLVGDMATRAITEAKGAPDLLMPIVRNQCKVVKDGEDYVVRVVDAQGDFRSDGAGGFMGVKDLVAELKDSDNFARAFDSEDKGGTGTPPGSTSRKPAPGKEGEKSAAQKMSDGLANMQKRGQKSVGAGIA